jgi:hypothetical protein
MRAPRVRFSLRWAAAAVIVAAITAVLAAVERRDRLRSEIAIASAETAYRDAKLTRELAEVALKDYTEGTFRREQANTEGEIKHAEAELSAVTTYATAVAESVERIRSKGYLLLIHIVPSTQLALKKAAFGVEQARSEKAVLEGYTQVKTLKKLSDQFAKARTEELATKAAYDRMTATPVGFIGKAIRRRQVALRAHRSNYDWRGHAGVGRSANVERVDWRRGLTDEGC